MTTTLDVSKTAEEAIVELVATKLAFVQVLETLTGTSPLDTTNALMAWATSAPVDLPRDEDGYLTCDFGEKLDPRVDAIEEQMLRAVGAYLVAKADRMEAIRG